MDFIFFVIVAWAITNVFRDVTAKVRADRENRIADVAKGLPGPMTPARRRSVAAKHDAVWTAREVLTGFPVTRTAWHSAWLAHKTAAIQQRHQRALAKQAHGEALLGWLNGKSEHKARAAAIKADIDKAVSTEPEPPRSARAVRKAAGNVIHAPFPRHAAPEPPEAAEPAAQPEPGPFRPVVVPEPAPVEPAAVPNGTAARPATPATPSTQGAPVPTGPATSEMTFDQTIAKADQVKAAAETHRAELAKLGIPAMLDSLSGAGLDSGTLGRAADVNDAHERASKAAQDMLDRADTFQSQLRRDHGPVNEAHQAAPGGGAEKPFYVPG